MSADASRALPKTFFAAYDVFGYLLPGALLLATLAVGNARIGAAFTGVWRGSGSLLDPNFVGIVLVAYLLGHAVAGLSSLLLERAFLRNRLGYPTVHLFPAANNDTHEGRGKVTRRWAWALLPSYNRAYSRAFQARLDTAFVATFGLSPADPHDRFWLCWSFNSLHHPEAYRRGTHFLNLYGFSRNISMALVLTATVPLFRDWTRILPWQWWVGASVVGAYAMFVSYTKLLRRLNDETYRGFVAITASQDGERIGHPQASGEQRFSRA